MPSRPAGGSVASDDLDALARAARAGDEAAFNALGETLRPRLVRVLRQKLGNLADAEDTAQQALLRWWQKRDAYDPARPFLPWLMTVALRLATDTQRAGARRKQHEEQAAADPGPVSPRPAGGHALETRERHDAVWATVREQLGGDAATAMWLFYGESMSPTEIGTVMKKRAGAVRVMLHRGRAALRPHLASWNPAGTDKHPAAEPRVASTQTKPDVSPVSVGVQS